MPAMKVGMVGFFITIKAMTNGTGRSVTGQDGGLSKDYAQSLTPQSFGVLHAARTLRHSLDRS